MNKEINLERLFKIIKSRIIIIMIVAVVSAVAVGLYTKLTAIPTYASTIKFCLVSSIEKVPTQSTTAANERNQYMYANELMETCLEAIQTDDAISEMNGFLQESDVKYANLGLKPGNVKVEQVSDTSNNFHVTIKTTNPELSCDACYAFESMAKARAPKVGTLTLQTIDSPKVAAAPVSSGTVRNAIIAFIGGFIITAMIFVVITVLDNTVKDSTAVCEDFGILLLAEIPNINQAADRDKSYEYTTRSHSREYRGGRHGK
ncbi:MAG: hypothetical protein E7387_04070 [Ruminococcaceae bacterium]|nr:hypothetical protein [Oscillospiraceae bacterium]